MAKTRSKTVIKTVSFRSCVSLKQYQTVHVEASADVAAGQTAEQTLDDLKAFVAKELKIAKDGEEVQPVDRARRFRV